MAVGAIVLLICFAVIPNGLTAETEPPGAEDRTESAQDGLTAETELPGAEDRTESAQDGLTAETEPRGAEDRTESAQALADRALELLEKGEDAPTLEAKLAAFEEGLEHAQQAVELDDTNADANFAAFANEGRIMLLEGVVPNPFNLIKINKQLDRTLELNPSHADALAAKGGLYRQLPRLLGGSLSKAEKCLIQAIAYDPNAIGARIELAETYREMGYPERGVTLLEQASEIAEQDGKRAKLTQARQLLQELSNNHHNHDNQ